MPPTNTWLRPAAQYLGKQRPCLRDARQLAIVPGIQPTRQIVLRSGQLCHLPCHHVQLLRAGLTTGHVQLQAQCLLCLIAFRTAAYSSRRWSAVISSYRFIFSLLSGKSILLLHLVQIRSPGRQNGQLTADGVDAGKLQFRHGDSSPVPHW